jgi:anaerobic nitric oxide reductase transcription regulator
VDAFSVPKEPLQASPDKAELDTAEIQDLKQATEDFQRQTIQQALDQAGLNWAQAARSLAMDRANLVRLAKRLGIEVTKQRNS